MSTIQELEAQLKALRAREAEEAEAIRAKQNASFAALPWEWQVEKHCFVIGSTFCHIGHLFPSLPSGATVEGVSVRRRKLGYNTAVHGQQLHSDKWGGMCYLRTEEGILYHKSGGAHVLFDPLLISEEEWDALKQGNIPDRFKRP